MKMKIGIVGAGCLGCYIGAHLYSEGYEVIFVGRASGQEKAKTLGIKAKPLRGEVKTIPSSYFANDSYVLNVGEMLKANVGLIIVTVKSFSTEEVANSLKAANIKSNITVVSFQNGVSNPATISSILSNNVVLHGMLPFAIKPIEGNVFEQGSTGPCYIGLRDGDADPSSLENEMIKKLVKSMNKSGLVLQVMENMPGIAYGKLTVNLNNGLCALTGETLTALLNDWYYRACFGMLIEEALSVLAAAGIKPVSFTLPLSLSPWFFALPNFLVRLIMPIKLDENAVSSMYQDLEALRPDTEDRFLGGVITDLGEKHNVPTPCCQLNSRLIQEACEKKEGSPRINSAKLYEMYKEERRRASQ
eukprot:Nk52_evm1s310 gene=Nk52_evmTU1s310